MSSTEHPSWGCMAVIAAVVTVVVAVMVWYVAFTDKVDPGSAGIIIDYYGQEGSNVTPAPVGQLMTLGPGKKLVEYSVGQVNTKLDAVKAGPDGKPLPGTGDPVNCPAQGGITLVADATVNWRVNEGKILELYVRHPGKSNNELEQNVVAREVWSAFGLVCGQYVWEDVYSFKREEVIDKIEVLIKTSLAREFLIVDSVALSNFVLPPTQQGQAAELVAAQQKARVATLAKTTIEQEALANQARVSAENNIKVLNSQNEAAVAKTNAERDAQVAAVNAKRDAEVQQTKAIADASATKTKADAELMVANTQAQARTVLADAEAKRLRVEGEARAAALGAEAKAITPDYTAYIREKNWNGVKVPEQQVFVPPVLGAR